MKTLDGSDQLLLYNNDDVNQSTEKLKIPRYFTQPDIDPFDQIEWETRKASITNDKGKVLFELDNVTVPKTWSQTALNIVASKYFHLPEQESKKEKSVKTLINRVVETLKKWGKQADYFNTTADAETFAAELKHLLVNQKGAFNSPVWFNVGIEKKPQCSACFINSVKDDMGAIMDLAKIEGLLFKFGSGTGTNFSTLRSSKEHLSSGGLASGPVSFMKGFDSFAGVIKSGGKTRRAAKMVILDIDHPDIEEFIQCKAHEEQKAWKLIDVGYDGSFGGEAYNSVFFQNSNNSVRVTNEFMQAVLEDRDWHTRAVVDEQIMDTYKARHLLKLMADAAHICGDPGIQFDTTINNWHTCSASAPIKASNPCSEFMFIDNSACNLASLNLLKFIKNDQFDIEAFRRAIHVFIIAQELIVDNASYPTDEIGGNSSKFRPLGLGYANLGALLMYNGYAYDSDEGRALAATITSLMTGQAYLSSAILASSVGPFAAFEKNKESMLNVINKHKNACKSIEKEFVDEDLYDTAEELWNDALEFGERYGYRNAQVTLLAPTGTIGFMMDCDTTGIEPDLALVKFKNLSGGGMIKLVNNTLTHALQRLNHKANEIEDIIAFIEKTDTIEGAPHVKPEHLSIFDCAFRPVKGKRSIHYMGHIRMMAAVQPFLSGAISKTVNMPNETTAEEIMETYLQAWKLGLKSIAIYRDGSKRTQPLSTGKSAEPEKKEKVIGKRRKLPDERHAITHKFSIAGHDGYITVGEYDDGSPGEIFIVMAKEGSFVSGLMDAFATAVSIGLQYGVPLRVLVDKLSHTRFEPYGFTNNPKIRIAKSIIDYISRWLGQRYVGAGEIKKAEATLSDFSEIEKSKMVQEESSSKDDEKAIFMTQADAPPCHACGAIMVRSGSCYKCLNCGETSGCS
jgi:ribonucleoside-diphosphate reductase alpha chain